MTKPDFNMQAVVFEAASGSRLGPASGHLMSEQSQQLHGDKSLLEEPLPRLLPMGCNSKFLVVGGKDRFQRGEPLKAKAQRGWKLQHSPDSMVTVMVAADSRRVTGASGRPIDRSRGCCERRRRIT